MVNRALLIKWMLLLMGAILTSQSYAHDYSLGSINIDHPWSPETAPNSKVLAVYMQIKNRGKNADVLLSASSPLADKVGIYTHQMVNGKVTMPVLESLSIKAKRLTLLQPGGLHLMLFGPAKRFKSGARFPLVLNFKHAGEVEIEVAVEDKAHRHHHD
ncbi:copper resistance protein CopZ [Psychromonas sp. psych-6C06]|uniref:copper chaperone PCu(A)C n=1 Tax=Psychromonas sp. psych-6C06 TaxID=2058089 RepID=UPI000C338732|nr:copper chaperone PCu(A)C [Psychromonas sp. psych-6C06]PKF60596.1 copper resistance protein CopZ [Psychromonas sp. psych-6C06]